MTHLSQLNQTGQHNDGGCVLFPHHAPKVTDSLIQGTLGSYVLLLLLVALGGRRLVQLNCRGLQGILHHHTLTISLHSDDGRRGVMCTYRDVVSVDVVGGLNAFDGS